MLGKFVLGTAQLSGKYGITNNNYKKINFKELKKIISFCKKNNILQIDTALNYSGAHKKISLQDTKKFKIISKIPKILSQNQINIDAEIDYYIKQILQELKKKKIYAILLHSPKQLLEKKGIYVFKKLEKLKKENKIKKIGISVYSPKETNQIIKKFKIDLIQIPYNILDRSFEKKNLLKKMYKKGIKIYARSCFLQGLLVGKPKKNKRFFKKMLHKYFKWIEENRIDPVEACIKFVIRNRYISNIVIGVDNYKQILDLKKMNFKKKINIPNNLIVKNLSILDPRKW